jgi:hypothetical protein
MQVNPGGNPPGMCASCTVSVEICALDCVSTVEQRRTIAVTLMGPWAGAALQLA